MTIRTQFLPLLQLRAKNDQRANWPEGRQEAQLGQLAAKVAMAGTGAPRSEAVQKGPGTTTKAGKTPQASSQQQLVALWEQSPQQPSRSTAEPNQLQLAASRKDREPQASSTNRDRRAAIHELDGIAIVFRNVVKHDCVAAVQLAPLLQVLHDDLRASGPWLKSRGPARARRRWRT